MKLTFFGLTLSSSWGNGHATPYRALLRALHRQGHQITFYEKDVDYYARRRDFSQCYYCNLVLYSSWEAVRYPALRDVAESDVAVVASYCPQGALITDDVLAIEGPLHVFYDLDTPVTLENLKARELDYLRRDQLPCFDLYLSFTGGSILQLLQQTWGARCVRPLYGCVDPEQYQRVAPRSDFQCDLSYMGTWSADRQDKFETLFLSPARRRPDLNFLLAGSLYPVTQTYLPNVQLLEHVAPAEHPQFYSSSRLTLNITRAGMARYGSCPSGRFFEAAACSTPIVSDCWHGIETFFMPGNELLIASDEEDVLGALQCSDEQLVRLARCARQRTLEEHTGDARAAQFLQFCEEAHSALVTPSSEVTA